MRKPLLTLLLLSFCTALRAQGYTPGNLFYDVKELQALYGKSDSASVTRQREILYHYYKIENYLDLTANTFLFNLYQSLFPPPRTAQDTLDMWTIVATRIITEPATGSSGIGGVSVTNFADGLAKFLVSRFKQELSMAFFTKFKTELNDPRFNDLKILFPQTWKTLQTIDNGIYQYSLYLNTLRQAFIQDLTNGFVNFQNLLQQPKYKDFFDNKHPELGTLLRSSLYLINSLSAGKHPGDILDGFNVDALITICSRSGAAPCPADKIALENNIKYGIKTAQLLSFSLRSGSATYYWIPADSIKVVADDPVGLKIYLGLLCQKAATGDKNIPPLYAALNTLGASGVLDNLYQWKAFIETFVDKTEEIGQYVSDLKSKKKSDIDYNDYYKLFNASLDLIQQDTTFIDLPYIPLASAVKEQVRNTTNSLIYVARSAADLYVDARTKNYSGAIQSVVSILDTLLNFNVTFNLQQVIQDKKAADKTLATLITNGPQGTFHSDSAAIAGFVVTLSVQPNLAVDSVSYARLLPGVNVTPALEDAMKKLIDAERTYNDGTSHQDLRNRILKYGSFIAAVAQAQNSDDVEKAIESVALPAGSYTIKQHSNFNLSLQGFVGYAYDFNGGYSSGVYAPVGLSANFGLGRKNWGAASLFASIIDVGAIVAYRFNDQTDGLKQDVRLESILSPSFQALYEPPNVPIVLCFGWRYTPSLFYSGPNTFLPRPGKNVINLSLLVDIPIITLINHPKQ